MAVGFPVAERSRPVSSGVAVDLALVLAVDCSSSIDVADYRFQMKGIAAALRNPALIRAIGGGVNGQIALTLVHWSTRTAQTTVMPWRLLGLPVDVLAAARDVEAAERHWRPGGTGLAAALDFSAALFRELPISAARRVIDVSGDGEDNDDGNVPRSRDDAVAAGITVNGLPIINGSATLEPYYRGRVIGGPGAFVVPALNIMAFREAMARKLLREVQGEAIF
jgi:hypothetical protein